MKCYTHRNKKPKKDTNCQPSYEKTTTRWKNEAVQHKREQVNHEKTWKAHKETQNGFKVLENENGQTRRLLTLQSCKELGVKVGRLPHISTTKRHTMTLKKRKTITKVTKNNNKRTSKDRKEPQHEKASNDHTDLQKKATDKWDNVENHQETKATIIK